MWNSKDRLLIRTEQQADYRRVEEITRAAFSYPERVERGGIGCPYEHWMVHTLRERDGIALIMHMIQKAPELGYGAILFFGRPAFFISI